MLVTKTQSQTDPLAYVQDLKLNYPAHPFASANYLRDAKESGDEAKAESFLANKSIIAFTSTVSGQTRQDVLNSSLIAQLAANRQHPADEDLIPWFNTYKETLSNIGWSAAGREFAEFESDQSLFEMDKVVIQILATAFGGAGFVPLIIQTLDAIKNLGDANNKILAFERNTHSSTKGAFVIAVVDQTADAVSMKLGAFVISSSNTIQQILFFKSQSSSTTLHYSSLDCTFQEEVYRVVRQPILAKLGEEALKHVAAI